ncbi:hypothetical protein BXZ70DRAFT_634398 [Cristinia sonorae]|uniref:Uncharacterized protein n=1 Tax=Cristinia sonorae TaxID=1940300 RepID=A0A8K0XKF5_9AGAR|nr:hypothetical protein BXZ70DRAFT_634398 [Cristinia sonorae]
MGWGVYCSTTATASLISRSSGFVGTTSQTMAIRRKKIFRSISRRLAPVRTHLRRLWHVIPHWNRQADVEEASSQSSLPLSPLTNRQLGSRFIQPLRALIRTIRTTLSLTLLRRSVTQSFLFYCRASVSFLSSIYAPITEAHRKRLARSYPTTNDVQMAAVLWLLEVSTDPAIRQNTILVASEVIWPNERFTALFPVKILDVFLEQLAAYHAENRRGEDGMDRMIPLCSAFLQVYWQWYRIDAVAIIDWIHQSGRPFINNHPTFVDTLPSTEAIASQDNWVFHQTVLTLQHIADMRGRRKLVDVLFEADSFPYSNHIEGSDAPSRSPPVTAKFRLRTTTLWYLSQLSFADIRGRNERKALLTQIVEYSEQQSGGADVAHYSLLSMALVLGFGPHNVSDAMHTLGGSCNVNWIPAAEYILEEIESLIHWAWPPHHTRSKIAWVFMIPKFDHLGAEALEVLAKIIGVLQSGTRILSHTWRPPSSHANSLSIFLGTLCRAQGKVTSQVLYRGITDVISIMSRMTDSTQVTDDSLTTALEPVALVKPPPGDYAANETAGSHTLFLQMQCEALAFIKSLLKSGRFHGGNLPTFFPNSYHWDLSQPRGSALAMIDERNILRERDGLFFKILKTSIVQATGTPELENVTAWLDDPLNLPHIRRWVQIAHRWLVPFKSDPFSSKVAKDFSIVTLLRCEKVRQPDVPTWGKEFVRVVRQTAVAALWQSWVERLLDAVFGKETEYGDLVETTRLVLRIGTESAVEVEWYIRDTLEDTFPRHIGELPGPVDRSFTLVESMLAQKLEDIEQLRDSNAKAGYHDGNNTNSKRTGVEDRLHGKSVVRFDGVDQVQSQGSIHPALAEEVEEAPKVNDEIPQPEPHAGDVEGDREADGGEKVTIDDHVAGGRSTTQVESSTIHD